MHFSQDTILLAVCTVGTYDRNLLYHIFGELCTEVSLRRLQDIRCSDFFPRLVSPSSLGQLAHYSHLSLCPKVWPQAWPGCMRKTTRLMMYSRHQVLIFEHQKKLEDVVSLILKQYVHLCCVDGSSRRVGSIFAFFVFSTSDDTV